MGSQTLLIRICACLDISKSHLTNGFFYKRYEFKRKTKSSLKKTVLLSCMRCIAVCPQNARSVNKALLMAGSMKLKKACSGYKKNTLFL